MATKTPPPANARPKKADIDWEAIANAYRPGVLSIRQIAKQHGITDSAIRQRAIKDGWQRDLSAQVAQKVRSELLRTQVTTQVRSQNARQLRTQEPNQLRTQEANQLRTVEDMPLGIAEEMPLRTQETAQLRTHLRTPPTHVEVRSESQIVDEAAASVVQVVRSHRIDISHGRDVVALLLAQLADVSQIRDELQGIIDEETHEDKTGQRRAQLMRAVSIPAHAKVISDLSAAMKNLVQLERQAFNIGDIAAPPPAEEATDAELDRAIAAYAAKAGVKLITGGEGQADQ